jgi:hypothetical protein
MKYRTSYDAIGEAQAVDGVIDVSPEVALALGLGDPIGESDPPPPPPDPQAEAIAALLAGKAEDVIPQIAAVPAEKADVLLAVREAEAAGKKRKTVLEAIDERLAAFTAPPAQ